MKGVPSYKINYIYVTSLKNFTAVKLIACQYDIYFYIIIIVVVVLLVVVIVEVVVLVIVVVVVIAVL